MAYLCKVNVVVLLLVCMAFTAATSTESMSEGIALCHTMRAQTIGRQQLLLSMSGLYGTDVGYVGAIAGKDGIRNNSGSALPVKAPHLVTARGMLRYGLLSGLDVEFALPFYTDITGWGTVVNILGDLYAGAVYVPSLFTGSSLVTIAGKFGVHLPTGNSENLYFPRDIWYVSSAPSTIPDMGSTYFQNKFYLHPVIAAAIDLQKSRRRLPIAFLSNTGAVFSDRKETIAADLSFALVTNFHRMPQLSVEVNSITRPFVAGRSITDAFLADPIRIVPSAGFVMAGGTKILVAVEAGVSNGKGTFRTNWYRGGVAYATKAAPFYGVSLSVSFTGTTRWAAGGRDGGVGNPYDRDLDSVPDSIDVCRATPEDLDGFEDSDGCPEYDNDKDGIVDEADGCLNNPEDKDSFEDSDGCPDFDNDNDGTVDSIDACPNSSGPEKFRGCPDEEIVSFARSVLSDLGFEEGTSKIVSGTETLDKIYATMSKTPKMTIEIQVHTDNRGPSAECSELSQSRADVIKLYLVSKGIRPDKIKALGLGSEFPVADNSTAAGRAENMRVEVRRID